MEKISGKTIVDHLNWRYATKKFDKTRKITDGDWQVLVESLRLAPSSFGLQPWKFVVIQSPELRKKLTPASWNQTQIEDCSHLIAVASLKSINEAYIDKFVRSIAKEQGVTEASLKGYRDMMTGSLLQGPRSAVIDTWASRQAYIAMGFFMSAAAMMQIDACPMEGIVPEQYDELLGLKGTEFGTQAVLAAGYRAADDGYQSRKKVRFEKSEVFLSR